MVKETRIVFEVKDIKAVRIQCEKCGAEIVLTPLGKCPSYCPICTASWFPGQLSRAQRQESTAFELLFALRAWLTEVNPPVIIKLELDDAPEAKSPSC